MKLGEALLKKEEYIKKIDNLKKRVKNNIITNEDNENNEEPNNLIKEYIEINTELSDLIIKISNREKLCKLDIGISISEAINIRDKISREIDIYKIILKEVNSKNYIEAKNENKIKVLINVKEIQNEFDKLSKAYNDIDIMIQSASWNTDL
ncbi:DIP1984 family protein [Brachyspira sp.]|uniref:DIP1984 family protein n=1 Tax=Brachyspira sp. TaxID=1977261 RepID=UPI0026027E21|nr:DIP1984 family protein [Brachyspira sp.]